MYAIVRNLPSSFAECVTSIDNNNDPINIELAKKQHDHYVDVIKQHVKHVINVPADEAHPGKASE
jgi:dimethylargininase